MGELEDKKSLLMHIQSQEADEFEMDENSILAEYEKGIENARGLAIKVLSIFGGILSALAFLGFLFILGIYDSGSGMLIIGIGLMATSILLGNRFDKLFMDAINVSMYVVGFILFIASLFFFDFHEDGVLLLAMLVSFATLLLGRNYLLSFLSVIAFAVAILLLIISNDAFEAIHFYIVLYAVGLTYFMLEEAALLTISSFFVKLYNPVRIGLIISFLLGILALGRERIIPVSNSFIWISSAVIILLILYTIRTVVTHLQIQPKKKVYGIYAFSFLALLPTILAPAISGSLLITMLAYKVNYKTGFTIGLIAFVYAVGQYYYDLQFTLLTKSILLMASGVLFLLFYFFLKKQRSHEEV